MRSIVWLTVSCSVAVLGCGETEVVDYGVEADGNPFVDDSPLLGKQDSHYFNPDGIEIEVDIEAELDAPAWAADVAPATLAQYAMTYLGKRDVLYLESLAEDAGRSERVEWLVDGQWLPFDQVDAPLADGPRRFRIRGMNAVLLHEHTDKAREGEVLEAPVPARPYAIMEEAGQSCAKYDSHLPAAQAIYWYLWDPSKSECRVDLTTMTLTVSRVLPGSDSFPEYDRLVADGKVTGVVLFGLLGDEMSETDSGFRNLARMARSLEWAGYEEVEAPRGRRFSKNVAGVEIELDLYSPHEFSGLSDHANFDNFQAAIGEHEVVAYDGHSMLGSSDFWSRPQYPDFYQVFLYGGCLGYQYYVQPIVEGKGGWDAVDIVSSVIAVTADANYYAAPFFAKLETAIRNDYRVGWKEILGAIRNKVGDSTFGASGVRDNCFSPDGSRCE